MASKTFVPRLTFQSAHGAYFAANQMAFAHNCMIRGLNALWLQSPHVLPGKDATDLLFFAHSWATWVANHLKIEEEHMFPGFKVVEGVPDDALPDEAEQHHSFVSGLEAFSNYCGSTEGKDYNPKTFRDLINGFAKPFVAHLHEEIPALVELDSCGQKGSAALVAVVERCEEEAAKQDMFVVPPMVMGLCDRTYEGGNNWPAVPPGTGYVINYVLAWKHSGAWRFLPSDHWRNPRTLAFQASNI